MAPVPHTFSSTTCPTATGADRVIPSRAAITSKIFPLGMGLSVFTGHRGYSPPEHRTVDVTTRVGRVSSTLPYSAPRGQEFPVTA